MKCLFKPENLTAKELLESLGFLPANRGFALDRAKYIGGKPIRIHALIELDGSIDLHEDHLSAGRHVCRRSGGKTPERLDRFKAIFVQKDNGEEVQLNHNLRRKYLWFGRPKLQKKGWETVRKYL